MGKVGMLAPNTRDWMARMLSEVTYSVSSAKHRGLRKEGGIKTGKGGVLVPSTRGRMVLMLLRVTRRALNVSNVKQSEWGNKANIRTGKGDVLAPCTLGRMVHMLRTPSLSVSSVKKWEW